MEHVGSLAAVDKSSCPNGLTRVGFGLEDRRMMSHILQVAYYPSLLEIRTRLLESSGYQVTSVLGNDNAITLDAAAIAAFDLVVVGFSAPHSVRLAMVRWFKAHYPKIPVIVLQFHGWEKFPEADVVTLSEEPNVWLAAVANTIKSDQAPK
jgi:hypothetical protein